MILLAMHALYKERCAYGDKYGVQYTLTCPYMHTSSVPCTFPFLQCKCVTKQGLDKGREGPGAGEASPTKPMNCHPPIYNQKFDV